MNPDDTAELEQLMKETPYQPIQSPVKGFKTKSGEVISWKEAGKRWKEGMQNLTPLQRTHNDIASTFIILVGYIAAAVALIFFNKTFGLVTYGILLIFIGSAYANIIKLFSLFGQKKIYKNIEGLLE